MNDLLIKVDKKTETMSAVKPQIRGLSGDEWAVTPVPSACVFAAKHWLKYGKRE